MKKIFFEYLTIFVISILLVELTAYLMIKLNFLPNGITPRITLVPHERFGFWHHKNVSFKLASPCWNSKVSYNNYGLRNIRDVNIKKTKKRIGIFGDSMSENIEVSDGDDFGSQLQNNLKEYEVLNFSVRSTGLGDHIELYKGLGQNFNLDYIFLFISDNDFEDNYFLNARQFQNKYKIENTKVIKLQNEKKNYKMINSSTSKIKNKIILFIKENFNSYILYFHIKNYLKYIIYKKNNKIKNIETDVYKDYEQKKIVYSYLVKTFKNSLTNNEKLFVFVNQRPKIISKEFYPEKKNVEEMIKIWGIDIINPIEEGRNYLKKINKYKEPFFSFSCDGHYSKLGAKFMADFVSNFFLRN